MSDKSGIRLIQLNNYVKPKIEENKSKGWVLNGRNNSYFKYVNDRNIGSPTNSAINNGYKRLIYGKGLAARDEVQKINQYARLKSMLKAKDVRRIVDDFQVQGMAYIQIIRNKDNTINSLKHVGVDKIGVEIADENNVINGYYFSNDWSNHYKEENKPVRIDAFGSSKKHKALEIYSVRPYQLGMDYFSLPSYQSCLQYAELEEEISNYSISHMKNGLSFGYIINIPDSYGLSDDEKTQVEKSIQKKLTGSNRAGTFMINFANGEKSIEVTALEVNDAHKQWNFLSEEAQRKIITAHEVVSPMLFGIKDANGFSSNADELDVSEGQVLKRIVQPKQDEILDALEEILLTDDITLDLYFKPLTEEKENVIEEQTTELSSHVCCSKEESLSVADALIKLGEDIDLNEWELIESKAIQDHTLNEDQLSNIFELAHEPRSTPNKKSKQDTSLFKIRYRYKGEDSGQREFCNKVVKADKVYRVEDINLASTQGANAGLGPKGARNYDIFKYKGGVNCKHFWQREIFLKKNNEKISVNSARKMILTLEPSERNNARWEQNPKEVAQVAQPSNNFWKLS